MTTVTERVNKQVKCPFSLAEFGALSPDELIEEVRKLLNVAYQLGVEEAKQMTRGKYLHVLANPKNGQ